MIKRTAVAVALMSALAGCASVDHIRTTDRAVDKSIETVNVASRQMQRASSDESEHAVVTSDQYVALAPIVPTAAAALPRKCDITFSPAQGLSLLETAQLVSKLCGMPVHVTSDALSPSNGPMAPESAGPSSTGAPLPPAPMGASPMGTPSFTGLSAPGNQLVNIRYSGGLAGFLDAVSAQFGLSWRVARGAVEIFRTETRVFRIYNLPTSLDMSSTFTSGTTTSAGVGGGSAGGSGGGSSGGVAGNGGSSQTTSVGLKSDPTGDLVSSVNAMVSPGDGKVFYAASNSTLVVTDTPDVLDRVERYVDTLNATYSKQVLINVQLLSVTVDNTDNYGLNWQAVYQNLSSNFGFKLSNSFTASNGAISGAINILSGNSKWSGSQALVNALSSQGRVRVLTEPSVVARNLKPAPIQVAQQTGYIAQSTSTITGDVGGFAQSSLTPGTVTTGFNMWALPMVYPDNKTLELSLSVNLSDLVSIMRKESGNAAIEVPEIANKMFAPDVQLRSGDTAVIASFKQSTLDNERSGVGSPRNWALGGGVTHKGKSVYIVIVVTPIVLTNKIPPSRLSVNG